MTLNYNKVWKCMNELEMVTSKICSAREILECAINAHENHKRDKTEALMYAADEYLQYYLKDFDEKFKTAWNEIVVKLHDKSPESQKELNDFWEENYYPEEIKDDGMRPWGHSDLEYGLANSFLTEDRISNFPGEQYTEEELNAMCDKATSDQPKKISTYDEMIADGWTMTADGFWIKESKRNKVKRWILPVEETKIEETDKTEYFITLPDDLLDQTGWKESDQLNWIDNNDGTFTLTKRTKPLKMNEC